MKKVLLTILGMGVLALGTARTAEAAALLNMSDSLGTQSCNTSLAFTLTNCGAGFTAVAGGNNISFTGTVGGYTMLISATTGSQPGNPTTASVQLTDFNVVHATASSNLTIDFGGSGFFLPTNPMFLSASQTGNWTSSTTGDQANLTGYGQPGANLVIGGTAAVSPPCIVGGTTTTSCSTSSPDVLFTRGTADYTLLGRVIITQAVGDGPALYTSTVAVTPGPVPEPATILLFGAGLFGLASRARKLKKQV